ncbi:MAG TPA: c-type cytochrome [Chitinophagales bacterium]|nr:c-type cytochrome [Chitinophagales bacterium]
MLTSTIKKMISVIAVIALIIGLQTSGQTKQEEPEKPKNLKVLPKNITHEELIQTMKGFSKALGVRCNHCHVTLSSGTPEHPDFDFPSDAKKEKIIARQMIRMVTAINHKYLSKMEDGNLEQITCVTCHRGNLKPMVSVDSLPQKEKH